MFSCENNASISTTKAQASAESKDPLPSWNEGETKTAIMSFVEAASTKGSEGYVPVEDRIVTFDNDGTLWSEQPMYFQFFYALYQVKEMSKDHPEWKDKEPFKSIMNDDMDGVMKSGMEGLMQIVMQSHAGLDIETYRSMVSNWMNNAKHPRFKVAFKELVYQPMLELIEYLKDNEFKVFIVSGGGVDFMRVWAPEVYGIPSDQIIGSSLKAKFTYEDGKAQITKLPELNFIDDKEGKPVGIHQYIGKKPVMAVGNSDGDLQMLQYCDSNAYNSFQLYVHHTDEQREWAYDRESHVGQFDVGLDEAQAKGWTLVDMKKDWKYVYPFELKK